MENVYNGLEDAAFADQVKEQSNINLYLKYARQSMNEAAAVIIGLMECLVLGEEAYYVFCAVQISSLEKALIAVNFAIGTTVKGFGLTDFKRMVELLYYLQLRAS